MHHPNSFPTLVCASIRLMSIILLFLAIMPGSLTRAQDARPAAVEGANGDRETDQVPAIERTYDIADLLAAYEEQNAAEIMLERIITDFVGDYDDWRADGKATNHLAFDGKKLVVTCPPACHDLIAALLDHLRHPQKEVPPAAPVVSAAVQERLAVKIDVKFSETKLIDVIEHLRKTSGLNMTVRWKQLANAGIGPDTPVSLELTQVPFKHILELVLEHVAFDSINPVAYSIENEVVVVGGAGDLARESIVVRAYAVADLVALEQEPIRGTITVSHGIGKLDAETDFILSRDEAVEGISSLVRDITGRQEWWDVYGGDACTLAPFHNTLLIKAPPEVHAAVASLFKQMRDPRAAVPEALSPIDRQTLQLMHETNIDIDFKEQTLDQIVHELRRLAGVNMYVDREAISDESLRRIDLTVKASNISPHQALELVEQELSEFTIVKALGYYIQNGVVIIGSGRNAHRAARTRQVYHVSDLLKGPQMWERSEVLRDAIMTCTGTAMDWRDGDGISEIRWTSQRLIVSAPREVQQEIQQLLKEVREPSDPKAPLPMAAGGDDAQPKQVDDAAFIRAYDVRTLLAGAKDAKAAADAPRQSILDHVGVKDIEEWNAYGSANAVAIFEGTLIVRASPDVHQQVVAVLAQQRQ